MTDHEARAEEALDRVIHSSCFGEGADFDFDTRDTLIRSISQALREAEEAEREACAKVAETNWMGMKMYGNPYVEGATDAGGKIAASIRSRGTHE